METLLGNSTRINCNSLPVIPQNMNFNVFAFMICFSSPVTFLPPPHSQYQVGEMHFISFQPFWADMLHMLHIMVPHYSNKFISHHILSGMYYSRARLLDSINHISHPLAPTSNSSHTQLGYHVFSPSSLNPDHPLSL